MCNLPIAKSPEHCAEETVEGSEDQKKEIVSSGEPKAPYFFYRNFSNLPDPDPSKPITAPGRIPNFPAKMMAILSRPDLSDIISWMPHGRSWKVHKPREFEVKVIPTYFEHSKFSSFIRQANGWGFRRIISKGPDRNSYYHEMFLRGKPHLIKLMKRPTTTGRPQADANTEPDFYRIAQEFPLPDSHAFEETMANERTSVNSSNDRSYTERKTAFHDPVVPQKQLSHNNYPSPHYHDHSFEPAPVYYPSHTHYMHDPSSVPLMRNHGPIVARALSPIESHDAFMPVHTQSMPVVARAVSPVQSHFDNSPHYHHPQPSNYGYTAPENVWTEHGLEPHEMPHDFEDPFAGGLTPVDFW